MINSIIINSVQSYSFEQTINLNTVLNTLIKSKFFVINNLQLMVRVMLVTLTGNNNVNTTLIFSFAIVEMQ